MKAQIVGRVKQQPGIHFRKLKRDIDCSNTTLDYHLQRIDYLHDEDIRGYRRIYPEDVPEKFYSPLAALNHDTRGPVLVRIQEQQNTTLTMLASALEKAVSTVSRHLSILEDAGLIDVESDGRQNRYAVTSLTSEALDVHGQTLLDLASDRFIEMWE